MSVTEEILIDRERAERIDGAWVDKPMGTPDHSAIARRVEAELRKRYRNVGRTEREVSFRLGEDVLIPDVAVFLSTEAPPLLCVEVRSPGQRISRLFAKCERYHDRGVAYCWVIDLDGTAWEYHAASEYPTPAQDAITAGEMRIELASLLVDASD